MDNYIGMKLDGRYELLELIGIGGMARIYKANDISEEKNVAVKILKNEYAENDDFLRRFRNESKAIALLSHPNIVKIFDVGFTDTIQFIVMEYIDGITLIDYIDRQGVLKWREALNCSEQILKALQHAHDRGIVHRDVKSQNVMLLRDGDIKVMDFGIARFNREINKSLTEKAIGSVHYISPEQARGGMTDEKSDLYSVGIMLYEMLTGTKPFDGDDALSIALMHTNKNPKPPREINSSIPEGLEEITLRAMQKETTKRYQTAGEMLGDLKEFENNPSVVFGYNYSPDDADDDSDTKHFNRIVTAVTAVPTDLAVIDKSVPVEVDFNDDDFEEEEVIARRSPLLPILLAVVTAFVIVAAIVITVIFTDLIGDGKTQEMPNLFGMSLAEAESTYDWLRFQVEPEYNSEYSKDTIFNQEPVAGKTFNPKRTTVTIKVSNGKKTIVFPDFERNTVKGSDVTAELTRLGLKPTEVKVGSKVVPEGYYVGCDRKAGDLLEEGDIVRVKISLGDIETTTKVPDFFGLTEKEADDIAKDNYITLTKTQRESVEEMKGKVIYQSTPKDKTVNRKDVVEVFVGTGPVVTEDPTTVERPYTISYKIPSEWSGEYQFKRYKGNTQIGDAVVINTSLGGNFTWELLDAGTQEYSIIIRNPDTKLEVVWRRLKIDFSKEEPTAEIIDKNDNVMKVINKVETTAPPVTAPPVTAAPAVSTTAASTTAPPHSTTGEEDE